MHRTKPFQAAALSHQKYALAFEDNFETQHLDRDKWFPHMLPHWNGAERSRARYSFQNSNLQLLIETDQPIADDGGNRASNLQTGHRAGPIGSTIGQFQPEPGLVVKEELPTFDSYTPKFGYFEMRLKAPATTGFHAACWMVGFDEDVAGEIRCFELHGGKIANDRSRVDTAILQWNDPALKDEIYEDWLPIDASQFQVYGIEWLPDRVEFYVNGKRFRTIHQSPQYKMQFMLGLYERPWETAQSGKTPSMPQVCEIDYFRGFTPE